MSQGQIGFDNILERCADTAASRHHHNIPAGLESAFIEAVYLPQAAADPIADHGMTQFLTDGDAHPIGAGPVLPGIEYQIGIGLSGGGIQPPEYVIELQAAGKLHNIPPHQQKSKTLKQGRLAEMDRYGGSERFFTGQGWGPQKYFVYFKDHKTQPWEKIRCPSDEPFQEFARIKRVRGE